MYNLKDYFNQKLCDEKLNYEKVGKILLKEEYGKSNPIIMERQFRLLSVMENFEKQFQFNAILKTYRNSVKKPNKLILNDSKLNQQKTLKLPNYLILKKNPFKLKSNLRSSSTLKLNSGSDEIKNNNNNTQMKLIKSLSQEDLPIFNESLSRKDKSFGSFLINSDRKIKTQRQEKKLFFPFDIKQSQSNFTKSINFTMKMLKENEEKKHSKYNKNKYIHKEPDNEFLKYEKNKKSKYTYDDIIEENEDAVTDPFRDTKNRFDYNKIMGSLKKKYKFYPYEYLEEHKNIDPYMFKFIVNNYYTKFSLFGKYNNILEDKSRKYYKKINIKSKKESENYLRKIIRAKKGE